LIICTFAARSFGWWLVLVCSERKVLLAGGWFVLREKSSWLVADKPSEQGWLVSLQSESCAENCESGVEGL
jgi:hypothetical protein